MKRSLLDFNVESLAEADDLAAKAAEHYQDFVYQKTLFEQLSKDMMASLKMKYRTDHPDIDFSEAELETRVRSTPDWETFRKQQFDDLREAGRREIAYENRKRRFETVRSALALRREETKRFPSE